MLCQHASNCHTNLGRRPDPADFRRGLAVAHAHADADYRPTPTATPLPTPAPTAATSAIDGVYQTTFTKDELANSPLLYDQSEVNDDNWGDWTFTFGAGRMSYVQTNPLTTTRSSGTFTVSGDAVTLVFDTGDNHGETFAMRWTLSGSTLSFTRDATLGTGPTPFLVKAWRRTDATTGDPLACCGAKLFPGTYAPKLNPALTFTVDHEVDLDCVPGYRCRGDVNVDEPDWLDLEFGNDNGSELMIFGLDKLTDPARPGKFVDPPADFAAWITRFKGVSIVEPARDTLVGGVQAVRLDIDAGHESATFGPSDSRVRLTALRVGGREVVIQETLGPENTTGDFDAAVDGLQAVIDSITFGAPVPAGQIVFEDVGDNFVHSQIWIENADGSNVHRLVSDAFTDNSASLSPDGKQAVFYSTADMTKPAGMKLLNLADGSVTNLDTARPASCDEGPEGDAFSPDGTHVAFERFCFDGSGSFTGGGIFTISTDGSDVRQVTEGHAVGQTRGPSGVMVARRIRARLCPDRYIRITGEVGNIRRRGRRLGSAPADPVGTRRKRPRLVTRRLANRIQRASRSTSARPEHLRHSTRRLRLAPADQRTIDLVGWGPGDVSPKLVARWQPDFFSHAPATAGFADLFVLNRDGSGVHSLGATQLAENHATWGGGR